MSFGARVQPAATAELAAWIAGARRGAWWTLGCLVPDHHERFLRVDAAPVGDGEDDWWAAQREVVGAIADVAAASPTSTRPATLDEALVAEA